MADLIEPVVSGSIRAVGAVAGHAYRVASAKRGLERICVRILLDCLHDLREGLALFTRSEIFGDAQRRILEESIEAVAQISTANSLHECPKLLWSALPPVFEMLKSLQPWTEDTHIQEAKTKFQTSLMLCEVVLGTTGDSHFLCWLKTLAVGFKVMCTMLYHTEHPSLALVICKGYLHTLSHIRKLKKSRPVMLHIHDLVWQFSFVCCDSSVREAWPLVEYKKRKPCHPVLYFSCVPDNMWTLHVRDSMLVDPVDVAVNNQGDIIVADAGESNIKVYNKSGVFLFAFQHTPSQGASLYEGFQPLAVAVDAQDNIIVSSVTGVSNSRVFVFDKRGSYLRSFGREHINDQVLLCKGGLAVGTQGQILAADIRGQCVHSLSLDGTKSVLQLEQLHQLEEPLFLCTANDNKVIVTAKHIGDMKDSIYVFDGEGKYLCHRQLHTHQSGSRLVPVGVTYRPLTGHVVVAAESIPQPSCCLGWESQNKTQLLFFAVDTLQFVNSFTLHYRYTGGCISAFRSNYNLVWVSDDGSIHLCKML